MNISLTLIYQCLWSTASSSHSNSMKLAWNRYSIERVLVILCACCCRSLRIKYSVSTMTHTIACENVNTRTHYRSLQQCYKMSDSIDEMKKTNQANRKETRKDLSRKPLENGSLRLYARLKWHFRIRACVYVHARVCVFVVGMRMQTAFELTTHAHDQMP